MLAFSLERFYGLAALSFLKQFYWLRGADSTSIASLAGFDCIDYAGHLARVTRVF
jgi:hypothetical protein